MSLRVAFLSGPAQGIGRAITEALLADGWAVAGLEIDAEAADELERDHPDAPLWIARGDAGDADAVRTSVAEAEGRFGRLDGLVHVAGVAAWIPLDELDDAAWQRVLDVNLTGAYRLARAAAPALRRARGAIVLIASSRAFQSEPHGEAYAASKGGLVSLAHALAASLGPEVRANAVAPGWIESGPWAKRAERRRPEHREIDRSQHPVGRVGTPEDVAEVVRFLLDGERAGFVTGQTWTVDGGMTRRMRYAD